MTYNNLQEVTTYIEETWDAITSVSGISYTSLSLESNIPQKDQLEVERIFTLPSSPVNIKDNIDIYDLHKIFVLEPTEYTVDEATKKITAFNVTGTRSYTLQKGGLMGTSITIPPIVLDELIKIRRKTYSAGTYVNWVTGSRLSSNQLNLQTNQLLKLIQEVLNRLDSEYLRASDVVSSSAPVFGVNNVLNMNNNQIINLGNPSSVYNTDTNYAINKGYVEAHFVNKSQNQTETITGVKTFQNDVIIQSNLTVDTNTLFVDAANNRVGVRTLNPTTQFTVSGSSNVTGRFDVGSAVPYALTVNPISNYVGININNTSPTVALEVGGKIKSSATVSGDDSTVVTTKGYVDNLAKPFQLIEPLYLNSVTDQWYDILLSDLAIGRQYFYKIKMQRGAFNTNFSVKIRVGALSTHKFVVNNITGTTMVTAPNTGGPSAYGTQNGSAGILSLSNGVVPLIITDPVNELPVSSTSGSISYFDYGGASLLSTGIVYIHFSIIRLA